MKKQRYIASGTGAKRSTRDKQLHIRVSEDQLARYALAASADSVSLSRWAVELMDAASAPKKGKGGGRQQRRASPFAFGDDDE